MDPEEWGPRNPCSCCVYVCITKKVLKAVYLDRLKEYHCSEIEKVKEKSVLNAMQQLKISNYLPVVTFSYLKLNFSVPFI